MSPLVVAAVLLYAGAAIGLGLWAGRSEQEGAEFWTAGRDLGAGSVGLSISAGFLSVSWSCVYAVQLFYQFGLGAIWLITVPWLLTLLGIFLLARRYRELPAFSQPEMVGERFGGGARKAVALALAFVFLVWGGAEIYVAARLLSPSLGIGVPATIGAIGLVVALYTVAGGFRAVVLTDKLQYALVASYVLAMGWLAWKGMAAAGGGPLPGPEVTASHTGRPWGSLVGPGLATVALSTVAYLPGWLFETDLWLRVQAARDGGAARRGMGIAAVNAVLFVGLLPAYIGIAALALFPHRDGVAPAILGQDGDAIFAALTQRFAPEGLAALVAVGLVAAAMSTIDTCVNVTALSVGYDLLEVHRGPRSRRRSGAVTACVVGAACLFALYTESLWDLFYLSGGVLTAAVAWPVAAVQLEGVSARGVAVSSWSGLLGTGSAYALESRGLLVAVEPAWLASTGLGFVLWGVLAAAVGQLVGARLEARSQTT